MQQTQKYKLNLIETSDTFSPAPLNENMEALEAALKAEASARQSADTALGSRVSTLEAHRIAVGTYTGDGELPRNFSVGFTPRVVILQTTAYGFYMCATGFHSSHLTITSGGFQVKDVYSNRDGDAYCYLALT